MLFQIRRLNLKTIKKLTQNHLRLLCNQYLFTFKPIFAHISVNIYSHYSQYLFQKHSVKLKLHFHGNFSKRGLHSVIENTVVKDEVHVILEFILILVGIVGKFSLNGTEVHWILDNFGIIKKILLEIVNGLVKEMSVCA